MLYGIVHSAQTFQGMSGGGIFNEQGQLIAISGETRPAQDLRPNAWRYFGILTKVYLNWLPWLNSNSRQPIQSSQNTENQRYVQRAYCSSSSGRGDWISWGQQTPDSACEVVRNKFAFWGQAISKTERGYYKSNGNNTVQVSCFGSIQFTQTGFGEQVFSNAIEIVRQKGVEGTCVYKIINQL